MVNETVGVVKAFLDAELQKYKTLKEMELNHKIKVQLLKNQQAFPNAKRKATGGVGKDTLLAFLGPRWKQWRPPVKRL